MTTPSQEDWISPKTEIRETKKYGKGLFAVENIAPGEKVIVWGGNYVNKEEALKAKTVGGKLAIQWDDDVFSVEDRGVDRGYFINHSCDANTWMSDTYTLVAKRAIASGEEITSDYALWEDDGDYRSSWKCQCDSPMCRKQITGEDWKLPEVQKRYKNHFSPLLNKRIIQWDNTHHTHLTHTTMHNSLLYWTPRILALLFVGFLLLFSFDGFSGPLGWNMILGGLIHLIIPLVVLVATIFAWKKPLVGAIAFFGFALYYVWMVGLHRHWSWYVLIAGPAVITGVFFLIEWIKRKSLL